MFLDLNVPRETDDWSNGLHLKKKIENSYFLLFV